VHFRAIHSHTPLIVHVHRSGLFMCEMSAVLRRCEVRQTYGCAEYKSTEDQIVLYETTDTVLLGLRCVQNCARTWTLNCADGQWIATDGQEVDCTSRPSVIPSVGSATGSAADMGNQLDTYSVLFLVIGVGWRIKVSDVFRVIIKDFVFKAMDSTKARPNSSYHPQHKNR